MTWLRAFRTTLLLVYWSQFLLSLRTEVPTKHLVQILVGGQYNKHTVPSKARVLMAHMKTETLLHFGNDSKLGIELKNATDGAHDIKLVQRFKTKERVNRLVIPASTAKRLTKHIKGILEIYEEDQKLLETETTSVVPFSQTQDDHELFGIQKVLIRDTMLGSSSTDQSYSIQLVKEGQGVSLKISLIRGASWNRISIPKSHIAEFHGNLTRILGYAEMLVQDGPVNVSISMYIEGMSSFRAQSMDFNVDVYFYETWQDSRLQHNSDRPVLVRTLDIFESIWHPDLYFANAKSAFYHFVTAPNFMVLIWPNGTVYHDARISLVVNCMMDLTNYPVDTQTCSIRMLSLKLLYSALVFCTFITPVLPWRVTDAYDVEHLLIQWRNNSSASIALNPHIKLADMYLMSIHPEYCSGAYDIGTWSCVEVFFVMRRQIMHHILQSYIPTALIVIISWFSFWLDAESVPGRVSLCITTLLALSTQANSARLALPQVSYAKAIDVWMGTCTAFVFGVMIEFTIVNYISRKARKIQIANIQQIAKAKRLKRRRQGHPQLQFDAMFQPKLGPMTEESSCDDEDDDIRRNSGIGRDAMGAVECMKRKKSARRLAGRIDRACRILFPLTFVIFNICYWPLYLRNSIGRKKPPVLR